MPGVKQSWHQERLTDVLTHPSGRTCHCPGVKRGGVRPGLTTKEFLTVCIRNQMQGSSILKVQRVNRRSSGLNFASSGQSCQIGDIKKLVLFVSLSRPVVDSSSEEACLERAGRKRQRREDRCDAVTTGCLWREARQTSQFSPGERESGK